MGTTNMPNVKRKPSAALGAPLQSNSDDDFESPSQTSKRLKRQVAQNMLPLTQGDLWPGYDELIHRNPLGWVLPPPEGVEGVPLPQLPPVNVLAQAGHVKSHGNPQVKPKVLPKVQPVVMPKVHHQMVPKVQPHLISCEPVGTRPNFMQSVMESVDVDLPDIQPPLVRSRPCKRSVQSNKENNQIGLQYSQLSRGQRAEPVLSQITVGNQDTQNEKASSVKHIDDNQLSQLQPGYLRAKYGNPNSQGSVTSGHGSSQASDLGMSTPNHRRASQVSVHDRENVGTQVSIVQGSGQHSNAMNFDRRSIGALFSGAIL